MRQRQARTGDLLTEASLFKSVIDSGKSAVLLCGAGVPT